jgi:hypothetical protein
MHPVVTSLSSSLVMVLEDAAAADDPPVASGECVRLEEGESECCGLAALALQVVGT